MSKNTHWTEKDLLDLKSKGYKVDDKKATDPKPVKIKKISIEKRTIALVLAQFKESGLIDDYVEELRFDKVRRFRFDWAIPTLFIAIEYEGLVAKKSRHTTLKGYTNDTTKYNLAAKNGWTILRYTALNYKDMQEDTRQLIEMVKRNTQDLP